MTGAAIPTLTTERLTLRAPVLGDFAPLSAFYATAHSKFVGGPLTPELTWRSLATELGHWALRGFGRWSVVETGTGQWVGMVGLWHPEGFPERELGWDLAQAATGKGYATEAAGAARAHAYSTLGWTTLISLVADDNAPSRKVAQRLGATYDGPFTHERYGKMQVWRHPSPEAMA
ncbi:MAG: GNAT family N-acetyltransferase [Pseudomonadota bacterium]